MSVEIRRRNPIAMKMGEIFAILLVIFVGFFVVVGIGLPLNYCLWAFGVLPAVSIKYGLACTVAQFFTFALVANLTKK